ncbi:hypothetical protein ACLKA7_001893 [Drosophila subpalustris]
MTRSYLSDRVLSYDASDGSRQLAITSGAAQGSILGPDLWNDTYDTILEMRMPDDNHLVAFADDVVSRDTTEAHRKLNVVMVQVQAWLRDHGLKLAAEKTELLLLKRSHIPLEVPSAATQKARKDRRSTWGYSWTADSATGRRFSTQPRKPAEIHRKKIRDI